MSASDLPTNPTGIKLDIDLEKTEQMPEVPEGYKLVADIVSGAYMNTLIQFRRDVRCQAHFDLFRRMLGFPEIATVTLSLVPNIPKPPKLPEEFGKGVDISDLSWEDMLSD